MKTYKRVFSQNLNFSEINFSSFNGTNSSLTNLTLTPHTETISRFNVSKKNCGKESAQTFVLDFKNNSLNVSYFEWYEIFKYPFCNLLPILYLILTHQYFQVQNFGSYSLCLIKTAFVTRKTTDAYIMF